MAIRRGRGVAAINYPTGMNLGGDPSQALVHSTPTGNFMVTLSSVDLGQGLKQVMAQICAETIGVPTEQVTIDTADTDTGPHCMGTFASRGTHRIGNAVIQAAQEARQVMLEVAAEELEVNAADLDTDGEGNIHVKGAPQKSISIFDTALMAHFKLGRSISGRGMFLVPRSYPEIETGAMKPVDLLRPCLHGRRGRCRRRDRRSHRRLGQERLRDRPRAQPEDGRAAARRRLVDGHYRTRSTRRPSPIIRAATMAAPTSTNI